MSPRGALHRASGGRLYLPVRKKRTARTCSRLSSQNVALHPFAARRPVVVEWGKCQRRAPVLFLVGGLFCVCKRLVERLQCDVFFLRVRNEAVVEDAVPYIEVGKQYTLRRDLQLDTAIVLVSGAITPALTAQVGLFVPAILHVPRPDGIVPRLAGAGRPFWSSRAPAMNKLGESIPPSSNSEIARAEDARALEVIPCLTGLHRPELHAVIAPFREHGHGYEKAA